MMERSGQRLAGARGGVSLAASFGAEESTRNGRRRLGVLGAVHTLAKIIEKGGKIRTCSEL